MQQCQQLGLLRRTIIELELINKNAPTKVAGVFALYYVYGIYYCLFYFCLRHDDRQFFERGGPEEEYGRIRHLGGFALFLLRA